MLAATSPAFADTIIVTDNGDDGNTNVQFVDASQFQAAAALQTNEGVAVAVADDGSTADASIDQSLSIDQGQINGGLGGLFFVY
jgi:hypothetical protein